MKTLSIAWALMLVGSMPAPAPQDAAKPVVLQLWPGKPPGEPADVDESRTEEPRPGEKTPKGVTYVGRPTITVSRPAKEKDTGAAIVVCPGGGYRMLAIDHEGYDVATWLTSIGITAILLKYRVPKRPGDDDNRLPLQDAQRALSLSRSKATEWGIDPARIGIMGFSAGGHLVANASTNFDKRAYEPVDEADKAGCRPDFAVLVYPGGILDRQDKEKLSPQIRVSKETPPSLLVCAGDDKGAIAGTVRMYEALRQAGVSAELHVYAAGGHGFGMRKGDLPCMAWPQRCEEWMRNRGVLKPAAPGR